MRFTARGYSVLELLLVLAMTGTLAGLAIPAWRATVDQLRASSGARFVAAEIARLRLDAVRCSTTVGLRFERGDDDVTFRPFLDGNGNGLRAADVTGGIDTPLGPPARLGDQFPDVAFGLTPGIPDLDGATGNDNGVRIGSTSFLSLSPNGSSTSGTIYIRGRRAQYAVRILGATARARFFQYDHGARRWVPR